MMFQEALDLERKLWTNNPARLPSLAERIQIVARTFQREEKFAETEPLLLELNDLLQPSDRVASNRKREAIECLWQFYTSWAVAAPNTGKMEKALEWRKKLTRFDETSKQKQA